VDFSHYSDETVQTAVDLVNSYEVFARIEHLAEPDDLREFLTTHGGDFRPPDSVITDRDLHEVRALRSRLRQVFDAADEATAAEVLNEILADVVAVPRVSMHGAAPHLHFEPVKATPARWLGAVTAMGLSIALIDGGMARLGTCSSSTCEDVFVDTSRNRSRRHCSDTCTTRENVAAYRERQASKR
jgi:predicted RNA-binding Zn ribbon-like protein